MFKGSSNNNEGNFWISYADLMAGLLFVFILLIGAIVSKSIILREDLDAKVDTIHKVNKQLGSKEKALENAQTDIDTKSKKIKSQETQLGLDREEIAKLRLLIASLESSNKELSSRVKDDDEKLVRLDSRLKIANDDLMAADTRLRQFGEELNETNQRLQASQSSLAASNLALQAQKDKTSSLADDILKLTQEVAMAQKRLKLKDKEVANEKIKIVDLFAIIDKDRTKYEKIIDKLRSQKKRIKSLTGINLRIIGLLKERLGKQINIDKKNGALKLSSNILFDKGSAELRPDANASLSSSFEGYIGTLLGDKEIKPYLDRIIIEGHTDSDGSYLYNLQLSQERALAVMNYLSTLDISKKYNLKKYLVASGRGYEDIIKINGKEDKEASRRIVIKFQLKNQDAMEEIEKILDSEN